jgi:DNA-binding MarR family transcriptional regulator
LAELLELTARMLHSRGHAAELFPAQWAALRYFARADQQQRTASALARFQGLGNGPVSRTVRTLVRKGLLCPCPAQPGGRARLLEPTPAGLAMLDHDPTRAVETAMSALAPAQRDCLAAALGLVMRQLADPRRP